MTDRLYTPVIEAYSGFPIESHAHRPPAGSVEWLLDAVARHAIAEQDALAQYEYLRTASGDPSSRWSCSSFWTTKSGTTAC